MGTDLEFGLLYRRMIETYRLAPECSARQLSHILRRLQADPAPSAPAHRPERKVGTTHEAK